MGQKPLFVTNYFYRSEHLSDNLVPGGPPTLWYVLNVLFEMTLRGLLFHLSHLSPIHNGDDPATDLF